MKNKNKLFILLIIFFSQFLIVFGFEVKSNIESGTYDSALEIELSVDENGDKIFYYSDKEGKIQNLIEYSGKIIIKKYTELSFFAINGENESTKIYTYNYDIKYNEHIDIYGKKGKIIIKNNSSKPQNIGYWHVESNNLNYEINKNTILENNQEYTLDYDLEDNEKILLISPDGKIKKESIYKPDYSSGNNLFENQIDKNEIEYKTEESENSKDDTSKNIDDTINQIIPPEIKKDSKDSKDDTSKNIDDSNNQIIPPEIEKDSKDSKDDTSKNIDDSINQIIPPEIKKDSKDSKDSKDDTSKNINDSINQIIPPEIKKDSKDSKDDTSKNIDDSINQIIPPEIKKDSKDSKDSKDDTSKNIDDSINQNTISETDEDIQNTKNENYIINTNNLKSSIIDINKKTGNKNNIYIIITIFLIFFIYLIGISILLIKTGKNKSIVNILRNKKNGIFDYLKK